MSESKIRKEKDNLYGKVAKDKRTRGLVISTPVTIEGERITFNGGVIDPQELRFSLLFWDELLWPQSWAYGFVSHPDIEFLEREKILRKPMMALESGEMGAIYAKAQLKAFQEADANEPGKWALAQGERSFQILTPNSSLSSGASIELYKAIPIPNEDIPLAEILEFKEKRRDELLLLRNHLELLSEEISISQEPNDLLTKRVNEVDKACSDLILVGKEWQFPMKLSSMKASLNIDPTKLIVSTATTFAGSNYLGIPMASTIAALAAAGSLINIKADIGFRPLKRPANPYRYAFEIERDLK